MTTTTLPNKLSDLLELAVSDSRALVATGEVELDMSIWIAPRTRSRKCTVCMAGAVMVKRLKTSRLRTTFVLDGPFSSQLSAINLMRCGHFWLAAQETGQLALGIRQQRALTRASIFVQGSHSARLNRAPWRTYGQAVDVLREAGL